MDRLKIPTTLALLGLSFTACGDDEPAIVGTWDLTMAGGEKYPQTYSYNGDTLTVAISMIIDEDLTGTYNYSLDYDLGTMDERKTYALGVDDTNAPTYVIGITQAAVVLTCELSGKTLSCTDLVDNSKSTFKKRN